MNDKITVRSDTHYWSILKQIGKLGELRVDRIGKQTDGVSVVVFRERTFGEFLQEKLSINKSATQKAREEVVNALVLLIGDSRSSDQLVQNVRDRLHHDVGISGRALRRDYMPVDAGRRARPLQGGITAAISQGNSVQILEGNPAKIKCRQAVLHMATAIAEAARHPKLQQVHKRLKQFLNADTVGITGQPIKVDVAATSWTCINHRRLAELQPNQTKISQDVLRNLMMRAVEGQSGAVVVEVIPDHLEEHGENSIYGYTDEGLRTQIKAAADLVAKAKKDGKDLVITFASEDVHVLRRMKNTGRLDTHLNNGTTQNDVR